MAANDEKKGKEGLSPSIDPPNSSSPIISIPEEVVIEPLENMVVPPAATYKMPERRAKDLRSDIEKAEDLQ